MAFTVIGTNKVTAEQSRSVALFTSEEYLPHKERDTSGNVLPNQEWQHPTPDQLHYCELGTLVTDDRVSQLINAMLELGADQMGGHARVVFTDDAPWLKQRTETWEDRAERERQQLAERERQESLKEAAKEPCYAFCTRCGATTESCKNLRHRGSNPCMKCGGGLGDSVHRYCVNCLDLPWREKREQAVGQKIVYLNEE
jgi:hypothetical protein